mmetsp:Transcript_15802/g.20629  ORF Transcript_15802/g.20629 Transcript_15802/m.20629 type:complete len:203 (+) Transcript_15802:95-703(+)
MATKQLLVLVALFLAGHLSVVNPFLLGNRNNTQQKSRLDMTKAENEVGNAEKQGGVKVKTRNPLRLLVLRLGLTEPKMTSPFNYGKYDGTFNCAYCGQEVFDSNAKYESGSGWPSFWRSVNHDSIGYKTEFGNRLECRCKRCESHLGHVFLDGPKPESVPKRLLDESPESDPRDRKSTYLPRFCINGASMTFNARDENKESP